jgi:hypothetical protein
VSEQEFNLNFTDFINETGMEVEQIVRRVGFDVLNKAKANTRVDTGRARGSWNITEEVVDPSTLPEAPDGESGYYGAGTQNAVGYISGEQAVFVTNNVEYIEHLDLKDDIVDLTVAQVEAEINSLING